jgi:hypothetical protein
LKFKFDLNSNCFVIYKTNLKKKNNFLIGNRLQAEFGVAHRATTRAACTAQPAAPWPGGLWARNPRGEAEPDPLSKSDPIGG